MVTAIRKYTIDDILARLQGVKKNGSGWMACCPAHADKNPSLSVSEKDGKVLLKCFAGCTYEQIIAALDMPVNDSAPKTPKQSKPKNGVKREIKQTYDYTDKSGQLIFQVVRFEPKSFSQRHPGGKTGWVWNMKDIEPVIYHLPDVLEAVKTGQTIWITEGEKDADNARAMGLVATTSPMGAGKWRDNYTNDLLGASQVVVIADKDAPGRKHASDIAMSCRRQKIPVKIIEVPGEAKDFTEWLEAGGQTSELDDLVATAKSYTPSKNQSLYFLSDGKFSIEAGRIIYHSYRDNVPYDAPLCNFVAAVKEEIIKDNGINRKTFFRIGGTDCTGRPFPDIEVPSENFSSMSWALSQWGIKAMIEPSPSAERLLRGAMQYMSMEAPCRIIYENTGWTNINGKDVYLTPHGAIGADNVEVEMPSNISHYDIPSPEQNDDVKSFIEASFNFLKVAKLYITLPLFAAMYMTPLSDAIDTNFNLWLIAGSGSLKTTIASLALCHYGDFDYTCVPAAWRDTQNTLERILFTCKDMPVLVDDWSPGQTTASQKEFDAKADYVCRGQANRQGRKRMSADTSMRQEYVPRGFLISTSEGQPPGESNNARFLIIEMSKTDIEFPCLTLSQKEDHLYRRAMAHYLAWLQADWPAKKVYLRQRYQEVFEQFTESLRGENVHLRLPRSIALLYIGLEMAIRWAEENGAADIFDRFIDESGNGENDSVGSAYLLKQAREVFIEMAKRQGARIDEATPSKKFVNALNAALIAGTAYLDVKDGANPRSASPGQTLIGWDDRTNGHVSLHNDLAYQVANQHYQKINEAFVKKDAVFMDLVKRGYVDPGKDGKTTVFEYIPVIAKACRVLHIKREFLGRDEQKRGE